MNRLEDIKAELREARRACILTHLSLLGCDVGPPRWDGWLADPELVVAHCRFAGQDDPTITQEIGSWLAASGELLSTARLTAIGGSQEPWRSVVDSLIRGARPWRGRSIDVLEASTVRLRLRGLLGVGSRAEICIALTATNVALTGSQIARRTGFKPQQINRELRTMHRTGWVDMRADGTSKYYRPIGLREIVGALPSKVDIDWPRRLRAVTELIDLIDRIVKHDADRGSLIEAFAQLESGAGVVSATGPMRTTGDLMGDVASEIRSRFDAAVADW